MGPIAKKTYTLVRNISDNMGTLGRLTGPGLPDKGVVTLELPWKLNRKYISCIPTGRYEVVPYLSPTKGFVYMLNHVSGRTEIEIHTGNTLRDIKGCILVGTERRGYNEKDSYFIKNSRDAFNMLKSVVGDKYAWNLMIQNSKELELIQTGKVS